MLKSGRGVRRAVKDHARIAAAAALVGLLAGGFASLLAAAPAPAPAAHGAPPTFGEDSLGEPEPFGFRHQHALVWGDGRATFDVPPHPRAATVTVWFEGMGTPATAAAIRVLAPDGTVELETRLGPANVQAGGRNSPQRLDGVLLPPGTHVVEYVGQAAATGHVEVDGGA
jgi:hypothetical protein